MRKLLLTSSQVSVLLSAVIIISCTVALFLSGYAIQQRTLRELRTAIRPRARPPKTHLPEQFRPKQVKLEDGTILTVESDADKERKRQKSIVIEVTQSTQEQHPVSSGTEKGAEPVSVSPNTVSAEKLKIIAKLQADVAAKSWAVANPDPQSKNYVPMTRAERRRAIKKELTRLGQSDEPVLWQRRMW